MAKPFTVGDCEKFFSLELQNLDKKQIIKAINEAFPGMAVDRVIVEAEKRCGDQKGRIFCRSIKKKIRQPVGFATEGNKFREKGATAFRNFPSFGKY